MRQGIVAPLDGDLALEAARQGLEHELPLADSMAMATAQRYKAVIRTRDRHLAGLTGVRMPRGR